MSISPRVHREIDLESHPATGSVPQAGWIMRDTASRERGSSREEAHAFEERSEVAIPGPLLLAWAVIPLAYASSVVLETELWLTHLSVVAGSLILLLFGARTIRARAASAGDLQCSEDRHPSGRSALLISMLVIGAQGLGVLMIGPP